MNRQPSLPPSEQTSTFPKRMPLGLTVDGATTIAPTTVPACVLALAQPLARNAIAAIAEKINVLVMLDKTIPWPAALPLLSRFVEQFESSKPL